MFQNFRKIIDPDIILADKHKLKINFSAFYICRNLVLRLDEMKFCF